MKGIRKQSADMARNDGKPLPPKFCSYYDGMHNYRPERVPETVWQRLCDVTDMIHYYFFVKFFISYYIIVLIYIFSFQRIGPQISGKRIQKSLSRTATPQILVGQQQDTLRVV